jgi:NADPH:quinone reductase-like Zn-dependent oxidoreductase
VQLAVRRGAQVTAVAAESKHAAVLALGAQVAVDRDCDLLHEFGESSFDVVIDVVGGPSWGTLLDVLRQPGRCAVAGAIGGAAVPMDLRTLYLKDITVLGCTVLDPGVFDNLVGYIERGEVRPAVAEIYPLDQIVAAQQSFLTKRHVGKIVMVIAGR